MPRKIKLSTAIRLGIKADGKKATGTLAALNKKGEVVGTCALGAAAYGVLGKKEIKNLLKISWNGIEDDHKQNANFAHEAKSYPCSDCVMQAQEHFSDKLNDVLEEHFPDRPEDEIVDLNDNKKWTREKIATFLEKQGL
jgi:hypothetical protein